ncbi:hypothetical protein GCM10022217_14970 [Chryseobacterium ginsenosidimutans]|uniref:hypothetical protein n=1 Tax=Chryseobacterium ginsenosidimutans TaxID=687846 RepID=UPI0031D1FB2B
MKKKFLIGALGLASVFTLSSFDDGNTESTTSRRFWGSEITGYGGCSPTGLIQADGTAQCGCEVTVTHYVFWIGISESTEIRYTSC